jgi:hypothetical protein
MAPSKAVAEVETLLQKESSDGATLAAKLDALDASDRAALFGKKKIVAAVVARLQKVRARARGQAAARGGGDACARVCV